LDCSPINRERELGLDRRETGWFYPTISTYVNGGEAVVVREELTVGANSDSFIRECAYDQPRTLGVSLKAS
jgi:hypothetical protein